MTSVEPDQDYTKLDFDREVGTAFDWVNWPSGLWEDGKGRVIQYNERVFVTDVEEMLDTDGTAQSLETALSMPLRQANKTIEKPEKDRGQTEFIREVLECPYEDGGMETSLELIISQMTYAQSVRKTFHEKVWTRRKDGRAAYKAVRWRPPSSCELVRSRKHGQILGFRQFQDWQTGQPNDEGYVEVKKKNSLIYIHGQHRDPLWGTSDLQVTYWAYQLKQKLLFLWSTFLGNQALPKVIAYGQSPTDAKKNAQAIAGLRSSGVLPFVRTNPEEKVWDILETAGQGAGQYRDLVNYIDGQSSRSIMAGWLDLTSAAGEGRGSYALSSDQSGIFLASRYAVAKELADEVTRQLIAPLVWANFGPDAAVPRLVFEKISTDQAAKVLELLQQLGSAQSMNVPDGFIDLLMERVAQYLDLDDDRMAKVIEERQEQIKTDRLAAEAQQQADAAVAPGPGDTPAGDLSDKVQAILSTVQQAGTVGVATPPGGAPTTTE
jgi:hypothetical protein